MMIKDEDLLATEQIKKYRLNVDPGQDDLQGVQKNFCVNITSDINK